MGIAVAVIAALKLLEHLGIVRTGAVALLAGRDIAVLSCMTENAAQGRMLLASLFHLLYGLSVTGLTQAVFHAVFQRNVKGRVGGMTGNAAGVVPIGGMGFCVTVGTGRDGAVASVMALGAVQCGVGAGLSRKGCLRCAVTTAALIGQALDFNHAGDGGVRIAVAGEAVDERFAVGEAVTPLTARHAFLPAQPLLERVKLDVTLPTLQLMTPTFIANSGEDTFVTLGTFKGAHLGNLLLVDSGAGRFFRSRCQSCKQQKQQDGGESQAR